MKNLLVRVCILFCLMYSVSCIHAQTIRYVKTNGSGNGSSWANASNDLQAMINSSSNGDEVWVAEGIYLPTDSGGSFNPTDPREKTFYINTGAVIKIYGGFSPSGNPAFNQRNWGLYPTILSGDIGVPNDSTDNSYHVITNLGSNTNALIDGFTIEKGNAQYSNLGTFDNRDFGGGVNINGTNNGPYFSHCVFTSNFAKAGGAVFFQSCLPIFYNCMFTENKTYGYGLFSGTAGISNAYDGSCLFSINNSEALIVNNTFFKNESNGDSYATISNDGGGNLTVYNSIFYGNSPPYFAIANTNLISVRYSLLEGVIPNVHFLQLDNIENTDPLFVNPANPKGTDGKWMTSDDGLVLQSSSPCANKGDSSIYSSISYTFKDILGNARLYGNNVDMGAYETATTCATLYTTLNTEICNGDSVVFDGITYYQNIVVADTIVLPSNCDSIVTLNLTVNEPTSAVVYDTICQGAVYAFGDQSISASGTYNRTIPNSYNCDSVITLHLYVRPSLSISITQNGFDFSATTGFISYQWLIDGSVISNANGSNYTTSTSGSYSVVVTDEHGCIDTSDALTLTCLASQYSETDIRIRIQPNPTTEEVSIASTEMISEIVIYNMLGEALMDMNPSAKAVDMSLQQWAAGLYQVYIKTSKGVAVRKLIKH